LPDVLPSTTSSPDFVTRSRSAACLIVAGLVQDPAVADRVADVRFADDMADDAAMAASMRRKYAEVVRPKRARRSRGHLGVEALMKRLGLIEALAAPATPRGRKRKAGGQLASDSGREDEHGPPRSAPPQFSAFRRACKEAQAEWDNIRVETSIRAIGEGIRNIVDKISAPGGGIPATNGYEQK
jgi:hypothetical protein